MTRRSSLCYRPAGRVPGLVSIAHLSLIAELQPLNPRNSPAASSEVFDFSAAELFNISAAELFDFSAAEVFDFFAAEGVFFSCSWSRVLGGTLLWLDLALDLELERWCFCFVVVICVLRPALFDSFF
jgi:hypothetical protein